MSTYLIINIIIIAFPLTFSFWPRIRYYKKWPFLFLSILITGPIYIFWDVLVTLRGDWSFNKSHVGSFNLFHLPVEEILFFITAPYSCIFIYESLNTFIKDKKVAYNPYIYYGVIVLLLGLAFFYRAQDYTLLALLSCAFFLITALIIRPAMLSSRLYWGYILISFVAFFIFNYVLTSYPVVIYNPKAIWGLRITTIPLEDFFYNYSMLSFYLFFYQFFQKNKKKAG
ncbi:MAG: lycopene cyclase domain-containing protein [Spirochaetes bacterium]|nr:lycopene cyclase domain-containing protein [Spirochaetota bacterium]